MNAGKIWHTLFLEERPSLGLSFFRIFVALTTGLHVIPSFFHLDDNYLSTAFKMVNHSFFTTGVLEVVGKGPDWLVIAFVGLFLLSWLFFLIGLFSQISCILMTLCCYFFYALNDFHIGTLSWDILLVTLFLMCVTPYHGDYFSIDAFRRNDPDAYCRKRPFFLQRLLQLQIASTFFYTALYKITAQGNWLKGNPIYALMNGPSIGVVKDFLLKEWLAAHPHVCYGLGVSIVAMELSLPFLWFISKTRRGAIMIGFMFHIMLLLALDVPAIFFFLFPAQMLLFIHPQSITRWIERRRSRAYKARVIYDGQCGFCRGAVARLKVADLWGHLIYEPSQEVLSEMKLVEGEGTLGGFDAFCRLCHLLPMFYPMLLLVYLPGVSWIGRWSYAWIARNRYLLHRAGACADERCFRKKV